MLCWMFFEQYSYEFNVVMLCFWLVFVGEGNFFEFQCGQIVVKWVVGEVVLVLMDEYLVMCDWFVGEDVSFVDIVFYVYIYVCEVGGFCLCDYWVVCVWFDWVVVLFGYVLMG